MGEYPHSPEEQIAPMLARLETQARANGRTHLHRDSGFTRHAAHRFYLRERFHVTVHHFAKQF